MTTIWKYPLVINTVCRISMPEGAAILTVQIQDDIPCIWCSVNPDRQVGTRIIRIFSTGESLTKDGLYIGTFQAKGGPFVFHVFDCGYE